MRCGKITKFDFEGRARPTCEVCGERQAKYKDYRHIGNILTRFLACGICSQLPDDVVTRLVALKRDSAVYGEKVGEASG